MRYLTDRKRATGLGSAKGGTTHFWNMTVSSFALLVLVPVFIFTFGPMLGADHAAVVDYFGRPFPALVMALTIVVAMLHFSKGVQVMIEDYSGGATRKLLIILMICVSYGLAAAGLFAVVRLAL